MAHAKLLPRLLRQPVHLLQSHLFVGFVVQAQRAPPTRIVPHNAIEDHHRAVLAALGLCHQFLAVNALAGQGDDCGFFLTLNRSFRWTRSPTTGNRRKQSHLVAVAQHLSRLCVLGVHADGNSAQRRLPACHAPSQSLKQVRHRGAFRQLDGRLR